MKARERLAGLWRWLRREVLNRRMFLWFVIAEAVFWSPCIAGVVLAAVVSPWWWTVCTVYMAFWALPLTPAIPLQIGLAFEKTMTSKDTTVDPIFIHKMIL